MKLRNWIVALLFITSLGGATLAVAAPQTASAACRDTLLTFPAWFKGLTNSSCDIIPPTTAPGGVSGFIWTIILNIIGFMLQLVGYTSAVFILIGGFRYMTSVGFADKRVNARKTIVNAVIGLGISIFSVAIINIIAGSLK